MRIFAARFIGEAADLSSSVRNMYTGMNIDRAIRPVNIVARKITVCGNKNADIHQKISRSRNTKSRKVLGLRNCSVWSKAKPSNDLYFGN